MLGGRVAEGAVRPRPEFLCVASDVEALCAVDVLMPA